MLTNPLVKAAFPQIVRVVMGEIEKMSPGDFKGALTFLRELVDTRLRGNPQASATLLNNLDVSPDFRRFLATVLWAHFEEPAYEENQDQRTPAAGGQDGRGENLPGETADPGG